MKIDINKIPPEGLTLEEDIVSSLLDLETDTVKFRGPIKIKADVLLRQSAFAFGFAGLSAEAERESCSAKADVSKITNVVTVDLALNASMYINCSRCFNEFESDFKKNLRINYPVNKLEPIIDLDQDIREEIILDYPIKPLCRPDCKGLCPKCGKNLNEGDCKCVSL